LSVSKKNTQDLIRINESLEKYYLNNSFKNFFSNKIFYFAIFDSFYDNFFQNLELNTLFFNT
jgi:hypothetical protein